MTVIKQQINCCPQTNRSEQEGTFSLVSAAGLASAALLMSSLSLFSVVPSWTGMKVNESFQLLVVLV